MCALCVFDLLFHFNQLRVDCYQINLLLGCGLLPVWWTLR